MHACIYIHAYGVQEKWKQAGPMASEEKNSRFRKSRTFSLDPKSDQLLQDQAEKEGLPVSRLMDRLIKTRYAEESESRPTIITALNNKGGVAKTTTISNLAVLFAEKGYKVLAVDIDPQGSLSQLFNVFDQEKTKPCIADVMVGDQKGVRKGLEDVMVEGVRENLDIVPSSLRFIGAENNISKGSVGVDARLRNAIDDLERDYDFILIDCPPGLGIIGTNAITALEVGSDDSFIIVPTRLDGFAVAGIDETFNAIEGVYRERRVKKYRTVILKTHVQENTKAYAKGNKELSVACPSAPCFKTEISQAIVFAESSLDFTPLVEYKTRKDKIEKSVEEYRALADEILEMTGRADGAE